MIKDFFIIINHDKFHTPIIVRRSKLDMFLDKNKKLFKTWGVNIEDITQEDVILKDKEVRSLLQNKFPEEYL